jgi:hypothetical protein
MFGYWNYYDDNFDWKIESSILNPEFEYTINKLQAQGLTMEESTKLFNSGYVCFEGFDILIDRFYGGPLSSFDMRSRFPLHQAKTLLIESPKSNVTVHKIKSFEELSAHIETAKSRGRNIIFRGQNENHLIEREIPIPYLTIPECGEV